MADETQKHKPAGSPDGGQFATKDQSAPDPATALPGQSPAAIAWKTRYETAEEDVKALIPLAERRFRDQVRDVNPDAKTVEVALNYDGDGNALVAIIAIDGEDADELDVELEPAMNSLQSYGYCYERLTDMNATQTDRDTFVFDLDTIEGDALTDQEFTEATTQAWWSWNTSAHLVHPLIQDAARRHGAEELTFRFADTGDSRRVTLEIDGKNVEDAELLDAMNTYVTSLFDMHLFHRVEPTDSPEEFVYRVD